MSPRANSLPFDDDAATEEETLPLYAEHQNGLPDLLPDDAPANAVREFLYESLMQMRNGDAVHCRAVAELWSSGTAYELHNATLKTLEDVFGPQDAMLVGEIVRLPDIDDLDGHRRHRKRPDLRIGLGVGLFMTLGIAIVSFMLC